MNTVLLFIGGMWLMALVRAYLILLFKCSYYETKLRNRDIDISHVENIGLWRILKS